MNLGKKDNLFEKQELIVYIKKFQEQYNNEEKPKKTLSGYKFDGFNS